MSKDNIIIFGGILLAILVFALTILFRSGAF
jgi:hypothetical protein